MPEPIRVSVQVATDDPSAVLPELLRGLDEQELKPEAVVVVENAITSRKRPDEPAGFPLTWLRNPRPQGYGRSHNQAIALAAARLNGMDARSSVLLLTVPDIWPSAGLLRVLEAAFLQNDTLVLAGPKLRRAHIMGSLDGDRRELELTDTLESAGISQSLLGRPRPIGTGERDDGRFDTAPFFGPDPACFAVRLSALLALTPTGPWLAEDAKPERACVGLFRRLLAGGAVNHTVQGGGKAGIIPEALAWRLVARSDLG